MKPQEIEICREAFELYVKGYWIEYKQRDNVFPDTITRAVQVSLGQETKLFEKLKKVIPQNIIKQVDTSSKRCFLIVGKDNDLIDGAVSYILHTANYKSRLLYENCIIRNEERIKSLFNNFVSGDAVFLRNASETVFRQISEVVRDHERRDWHSFLFVSAENSPEVIPSQFKPIYLETTVLFEDKTLTVAVNGKKYTNLQDYEYKLCKLLYENRGVCVDYERIKKEVFCSMTDMQQIHNTKSSIEKKLNGCVNIESKRGVGYMMTV